MCREQSEPEPSEYWLRASGDENLANGGHILEDF